MRSSPTRKRKKNKIGRISFLILAVILLIFGILFFSGQLKKSTFEKLQQSVSQIGTARDNGPKKVEQKPDKNIEISALEQGGEPQEPQKNIQHTQVEKKQEPIKPMPPSDLQSKQTCNDDAEKLNHFFQTLDSKEYMQTFSLEVPLQKHFIELTKQLLDNPPVVSRETDDLYTLLTNMAHFFRVIGKDNIVLIKTILGRERDKIEDIAQYLYNTLSQSSCAKKQYQIREPNEKMYEYAAFFLNTMGGRSYLFRRESRSRLLVNYYAVLLIEKSDEMELNYHGINLNEYIPFLIREIEDSNQLVYKEVYLDRLYSILEGYE